MRVQEGKWYATQRGRVVGPLQRMHHAMQETYWYPDYFETGIWDARGRCGHPETKTGWSYGDLTQEVGEPENEKTLHLCDSV